MSQAIHQHGEPAPKRDTGHRRERSIIDVLNQLGLRKLQTTPTEFNLKLLRAERMSRETGQVVMISGPVIAERAPSRPSGGSRTTGMSGSIVCAGASSRAR